MKLSKSINLFLRGGLIALITSILVIGVFFSSNALIKSYSWFETTDSFDWEFNSPLKLSVQIEERSQDLLLVSVYAGETSDFYFTEYGGFSHGTKGLHYFNHEVIRIFSWFNTRNEKQYIQIEQYFNQSSNPYVVSKQKIEQGFLLPLSIAFAKDIECMKNMTNISSLNNTERNQILADVLNVGDPEYHVDHVYKDGSFIMFELYKDVFFFYLSRFSAIKSNYQGSVSFRPDTSFEPQWFMGTIQNFMTNYTIAINQQLDLFFLN